MLYLLAFLLPPLAVLCSGRPVQALVNILLTGCLWIPGAIHALLVVNRLKVDQYHDRLIAAIKERQRN